MIVLESERLLFREHDPGDLNAYCAIKADSRVRRYVGGAPRSRQDAERKFRDNHLKSASNELALRATIFKPENRYIGYCGLYPRFGPRGVISGEAALGFYFSPEWDEDWRLKPVERLSNWALPSCSLYESLPP